MTVPLTAIEACPEILYVAQKWFGAGGDGNELKEGGEKKGLIDEEHDGHHHIDEDNKIESWEQKATQFV